MSGHHAEEEYSEEINVAELIQPYLKKWQWFAIGLLFAVALAVFYIKKTAPVYEMRSTVLIKDTKKSALDFGMMTELSSFGGRSSSTINNEMELLKSKRLMKEVIKGLGIQGRLYSKKGLTTIELYSTTAPVVVRVISEKSIDASEKIEPLDIVLRGKKIELHADNLKNNIVTTYNKIISLPYANIMIIRNPNFESQGKSDWENLYYQYASLDSEITRLQKMSDISLVDKDATVIGIGLKYPNIEKGKAIISALIDAYNQDAIKDKNSESKKTKEFIDDRLAIISKELGEVETEKENFKTANRITDIPVETQLNLTTSAAASNKLVDTEVQLSITNDLIGYLSKQGLNQVLPSTIGLSNPTASGNIAVYNELIMQRNSLLESATPQNPTVLELSKQIANVRAAIMDNLLKNRTSLNALRNQIQSQQNELTSKIRKVPSWEKAFRNIERQQSIKENLYLILLQKREETAILLANTTPKAKILDEVFSYEKPVAPKKMLVIAAALLLGGLFPFLLIYVKRLLNVTIQDMI